MSERSHGPPGAQKAWAAALVSALLFGASTPVARTLVGGFGPFGLAGLLDLGAAAARLPVLLGGRPERPLRQLGRTNRWRLAGVILFGGLLGPLFLLFGLRLVQAASAALGLNLETP